MTRKGVWSLQEVRDKYLASAWVNEGSIFSWGSGSYGQLGQGSVTQRSSPVQLSGVWNSLGGHNFGGTGVKEDGSLWTWGLNTDGQLGLGNASNVVNATQIGTDEDWSTATKSKAKDQYVIKSDGSLYAMGYNQNGRLGLNDAVYRSSPTQMPGTTWKWVMSAGQGAHAIKTDGTLWAWGLGTDGRIGDNDNESYSSPKQIPGTSWAYVNETVNACIATRTDGTLWTWGGNTYGQLGHNDRQQYSSPRQIPGTDWNYDDGMKTTMHGEQLSGAIKTDGTLWMWGYNHTGALGQNSPMPSHRSSPTQVPGTWKSIDIGGTDPTVIATKTDGTLWAWGYFGEGRGGVNDNTNRSSPTQVGTDTKWDGPLHTGRMAMFGLQKSLTPSQI